MHSLASILHETPVGLCRARSRRWTRERERERGRSVWKKEDAQTRGKKDGIRGSGYGAVCKCYDPLLCFALIVHACSSSALDTFHAMAPMGPCLAYLLPSHGGQDWKKKKLPAESFRNIRIYLSRGKKERGVSRRSEILRAAWWKKRSSSPNPRQSIERGLSDDRRITTFVNGLNTRPRQLCELSKIDTLSLQRSTWISSLTSGNYEPLDSLRVRCKIILISCWEQLRRRKEFSNNPRGSLFLFQSPMIIGARRRVSRFSRKRKRPSYRIETAANPPGKSGRHETWTDGSGCVPRIPLLRALRRVSCREDGLRISRKGENCIGGLLGATRFKCKSD